VQRGLRVGFPLSFVEYLLIIAALGQEVKGQMQ